MPLHAIIWITFVMEQNRLVCFFLHSNYRYSNGVSEIVGYHQTFYFCYQYVSTSFWTPSPTHTKNPWRQTIKRDPRNLVVCCYLLHWDFVEHLNYVLISWMIFISCSMLRFYVHLHNSICKSWSGDLLCVVQSFSFDNLPYNSGKISFFVKLCMVTLYILYVNRLWFLSATLSETKLTFCSLVFEHLKDAIDLLQGHYIVSVSREMTTPSQKGGGLEAVAVSTSQMPIIFFWGHKF